MTQEEKEILEKLTSNLEALAQDDSPKTTDALLDEVDGLLNDARNEWAKLAPDATSSNAPDTAARLDELKQHGI